MSIRLSGALLLAAASWLSCQQTPHAAATSELRLRTSDPALQAAFDWARGQALQYVSPGGDPAGDWYEAALPNREAFCMRDVAHQAMGAHALGLQRQNRNMLLRFAENISASKDWCSYWEINRHNQPAPVDYRNDNDFWYNLPANFDVLDACFRVYLWSGDRSLLDDPVFANFYARTISDYVERWDLGLDRILQRSRVMNLRGEDAQRRFGRARGIPGYDEQQPDFICGADLVASQMAAYRSYDRISMLKGRDAKEYRDLAERTRAFLNRDWWDASSGTFYAFALPGGRFAPGGVDVSVLYFGAAGAAHEQSALDVILRRFERQPAGIEMQSHLPEILYRYGRADAAYGQILDLSRPDKKRREYPEVSFAVIGAIVNGALGIEPDVTRIVRDAEWTPAFDGVLTTLSRLTGRTSWAELIDVPFRGNRINVRHEGTSATVLTNASGPPLRWRACFAAGNLRVQGATATRSLTAAGFSGQLSCAEVTVPAGRSVTARSVR